MEARSWGVASWSAAIRARLHPSRSCRFEPLVQSLDQRASGLVAPCLLGVERPGGPVLVGADPLEHLLDRAGGYRVRVLGCLTLGRSLSRPFVHLAGKAVVHALALAALDLDDLFGDRDKGALIHLVLVVLPKREVHLEDGPSLPAEESGLLGHDHVAFGTRNAVMVPV